jgi:antitoxin component YwqK of YwqJK toxin-antitoxin module
MKNFNFNGKLYGTHFNYYDCIWFKCLYINDKEKECIVYYKNSNIYLKLLYLHKYGKINFIKYYESGNIFKKCYYINGKKEGEYIEYYDNGEIKCKCYYKNDKILK